MSIYTIEEYQLILEQRAEMERQEKMQRRDRARRHLFGRIQEEGTLTMRSAVTSLMDAGIADSFSEARPMAQLAVGRLRAAGLVTVHSGTYKLV